jgi:hypothetical protein
MEDKNVVEVMVEDETSGVEVEMPEVTKEEPQDEEISSYSQNVQKRIKELTAQRHDERRAKEEALAYAKAVMEENAKLKERLSSGESVLLKTMQMASEKDLDDAKKKYKEALYTGDADKIAAAVEDFSKSVIRSERFKQAQSRQEEPRQEEPRQNHIDTKAETWKNANRWFGPPGQEGVNNEMTHFAMGVHKDLVGQYGDLYASTNEYYERISARVREKFPEYFGVQSDGERKRSASIVAPASRTSPPKRIRLTASEANMARRLQVPVVKYAEELAKLQMEGKL